MGKKSRKEDPYLSGYHRKRDARKIHVRPKEKWFENPISAFIILHPIISAIVIFILIGFFVGFLNGFLGTVPIEDTSYSSDAEDMSTPNDEPWLVTVNSATKQSIIGDCGELGWACDKAGSGKAFLVLDITVENQGVTDDDSLFGMADYVSSSDFKLKDNDGYVYSEKYTSYLDQEFSNGEIPLGDRVRGKIAFEIPTTANGFKLIFENLVLGFIPKDSVVSRLNTTSPKPPVTSGTLDIERLTVTAANLQPIRLTIKNTGEASFIPKFDITVTDNSGEAVCEGSPLFGVGSITAGNQITTEITLLVCILKKDGDYMVEVMMLDENYKRLDSDQKSFTVNYWGQFNIE